MLEVFFMVLVVLFFIILICLDNKIEKNNINVKNDENKDILKEKMELYRQCYNNKTDEKVYKIGEWENEVRKDLHSIVKINERYKTNKNVSILIGDYNKSSVSNSVSVLESMGLKVSIANSGLEIIDRIEKGEKYDLIITNNIYDKGHFDGLDLLYELKNRDDFEIPIVVLTVSQNKRELFLEKGFDEYMSKLLDQDKVLRTLPNVIKDLKFKKVISV